MYFVGAVFLMILVGFPTVYYEFDLITSQSQETVITVLDALLFSIKSALGIGHRELYTHGYAGEWVRIMEGALSWVGLGVFIWWVTRRLEQK